MPIPPHHQLAGTTFANRYEVKTLLRREYDYAVYHAYNSTQDIMLYAYDPLGIRKGTAQKRYLLNMETALKINHPHITPVMDYGIHETIPYSVHPYYTGGMLRERMSSDGMPLADCQRIVKQIAQGLDYLHDNRFLYGKLLPENIYFDDQQRAVIHFTAYTPDYGDIVMVGFQRALRYQSIEQVKGFPPVSQSDVFTLGVLLYEMLTGNYPFDGDNVYQMLYNIVMEPASVIEPPAVNAVIQKALAKDPQERYSSAGEMAAALAAIDVK